MKISRRSEMRAGAARPGNPDGAGPDWQTFKEAERQVQAERQAGRQARL